MGRYNKMTYWLERWADMQIDKRSSKRRLGEIVREKKIEKKYRA